MGRQKIVMTYDEYDEICDIGERLIDNGIFIPTKKEAALLTNRIIFKYFLALIIIIEEYGVPETEDEKTVKSYFNKIIKNRVAFTEDMAIHKPEKLQINEKEAIEIESALEKCNFNGETHLSPEAACELFTSYPEWAFGIAYMLIRTDEENIAKKNLEDSVLDIVSITEDTNIVEMTEEDYDAMVELLGADIITWEGWIPSKNYIETILLPNIKKTYDYLIWLSIKNKEEEKDKDFQEYIDGILDSHIRFPDSRSLTGYMLKIKRGG